MKKNRPGTLLTIVASPDARERLTSLVFRETTTIGVRYHEVTRERLDTLAEREADQRLVVDDQNPGGRHALV